MTVTRFATIDEHLGEGCGRFFGDGFKRVQRELSDLDITLPGDGDGEIRCRAILQYPNDWSCKGSRTDLQPHLSTIDGLLITVDLVEAYLSRVYGFDAAQRRRMWLSTFVISAGAAPGKCIDELAVAAIHRSCIRTGAPGTGYRSHFECRIGPLKVRCDVEHPPPGAPSPAQHFSGVVEILGARAGGHYGSGYQRRIVAVRDLTLDSADRRVDATAGSTPHLREGTGFEGAYSRAMSMLDTLLVLAQLAQVLVYDVDSIPRAESNTLWMRRCALRRQSPDRPLAIDATATAAIEQTKRLTLKGATWRTFDVVGRFGGLVGRASLAHQLPERLRSGAPADQSRSAGRIATLGDSLTSIPEVA